MHKILEATRLRRHLSVGLVLITISACSVHKPSDVSMVRVQGYLSQFGKGITPCQNGPVYNLVTESKLLPIPGAEQSTFVDAYLDRDESEGTWSIKKLYRLEPNKQACQEPNFNNSRMVALGMDRSWKVTIMNDGLVLDTPKTPIPLAVPYVEEILPNGASSYSSIINNQTIDLWITEQKCSLNQVQTQYGFKAQLRLNGEQSQGCAYPNGAFTDNNLTE